jgi:hypothetical protein
MQPIKPAERRVANLRDHRLTVDPKNQTRHLDPPTQSSATEGVGFIYKMEPVHTVPHTCMVA